jgi:hypothetical protein
MPRGNKQKRLCTLLTQSRRFFCFINIAVSQTTTIVYMMDTFYTSIYIYALYGTFTCMLKFRKDICAHPHSRTRTPRGNTYTPYVF